MIRSLLFSTLYPSAARPNHGLFVETRLRKLVETRQVESRVVAPVPWFPSGDPRFGAYAAFARTPAREARAGIEIVHPRYPLIPKVGMTTAPALLALGAVSALRRQRAEGFDFDLIDAHYFYPDGVAAALLAGWAGRPLVITARGSDLNVIGAHRLARAQMLWAARRAAAVVTVSRALADVLLGWGVDSSKVQVLRNGVDTSVFSPVPGARESLDLQGGPVLLTVGNLVPLKRQTIALGALKALLPSFPGALLLIVGAGPERDHLERHAEGLGISPHVRFIGAVPQGELSRYYSAADVMLLPSEREGWPNVVLESLACGARVVASRVGGVPEILVDPLLGECVDGRQGVDFAAAVARVLAAPVDRTVVRAHAMKMGWQATSDGQVALFRRLLQREPATGGKGIRDA